MYKRTSIRGFAILIVWMAITASFVKAEDPIPPPQYRVCNSYYHDPEMTQWAGMQCKECNGEVVWHWGEATHYFFVSSNPCDG